MTAPFCAAVVEMAGAAVCGFEELPDEGPPPLAQPTGNRMAAASVHQILNCDEPAMELIFPLCINRHFPFASRLRPNIPHLPPPAIGLHPFQGQRPVSLEAGAAIAAWIRGSEAGRRGLTIPERSVFILDSSRRSAVFAF